MMTYNLIGCPKCGQLQINQNALKFKCKFCGTYRIYRNVTVYLFQSSLDACRVKMLQLRKDDAPSLIRFK